MGTCRRAYDLLRGYINNEWDRIRGVEDAYAEKELQDAIESPAPKTVEPKPQPVTAEPTPDNMELARRILGLGPTATFADIRHAFERLNKRSGPQNFPEGSAEAARAADIQKRVNWAYELLTEGMDSTERRFRSLEIE